MMNFAELTRMARAFTDEHYGVERPARDRRDEPADWAETIFWAIQNADEKPLPGT